MGKSLVIKNADFSAVAVDTEIVVEFPYVVNVGSLTAYTYSLNGANWGSSTDNSHVEITVPVGATTITFTTGTEVPSRTTYYAFLKTCNPEGGAQLDVCSGETGMHTVTNETTVTENIPADCNVIAFTKISSGGKNYLPTAITLDNQ